MLGEQGPMPQTPRGLELDGRDRRCFYVDGSACRRDRHFGFALCPGVRDGEVFGVNVVRACCFEGRDAPIYSALHGRTARHTAANLVGEVAQIGLKLRGLQGFLENLLG